MNELWQSRTWRAWALTPVSVLFYLIATSRRALFSLGILQASKFSVPVIVVGNISVGGTGKTPIVSSLVKRLQAAGMQPGIVSRGYGAKQANEPRMVTADTPVALAGDEPLFLARDTSVPVCICAKRSLAVQTLIDQAKVNVVISDDGMQHYAMTRDIEIAVVDGQRGFGNRFVLPAGPLREPIARLRSVDVIAIQLPPGTDVVSADTLNRLASANAQPGSGRFFLQVNCLRNLNDNKLSELATLQAQQVHAVAGLGNPQRFFASLTAHGLSVVEHAYPDHYRYTEADLDFDDALPVLVTSKDAVKIRELNLDLSRVFEVCVQAVVDDDLDAALNKVIAALV